MKVYLNDQWFEQEEAKISVFDHGLLYGDGVFEGIRLYDGCVFKLKEHLDRLAYSAKSILLEYPWSNEYIGNAVCETCRKNNLRNGYIRLVITRGAGNLGLNPRLCQNPQLIIISDDIQLYPESYYQSGLKIITAATRRINPSALPPMVKSLNYLNNILAKIEALNAGTMEALMLNDQGYVAECTGDNVFIVHKDRLITPHSSAGALQGITREVIIDIAKKLEIPVVEGNLTRYDLWNADEVFLTGTAAEVIPVVELDGRLIGSGKPGKITKEFLRLFKEKVNCEGVLI